MNADAAVIVFARAPLPGHAKTRLVPTLGAWGAAHLQARLTERAVQTAIASRCGPVELHGAPDARHAFFRKEARRFGVTLRGQSGVDLGERMHHALRGALRRHRYALLIGVDAPELRARDLRRALRLLRSGCDVVIAPAEDGGYALIACRRAPRPIFERIEWGGNEVCARTVEHLARLRLRWRALRTVWDVDRPEDVERLGRRRQFLTSGAR